MTFRFELSPRCHYAFVLRMARGFFAIGFRCGHAAWETCSHAMIDVQSWYGFQVGTSIEDGERIAWAWVGPVLISVVAVNPKYCHWCSQRRDGVVLTRRQLNKFFLRSFRAMQGAVLHDDRGKPYQFDVQCDGAKAKEPT